MWSCYEMFQVVVFVFTAAMSLVEIAHMCTASEVRSVSHVIIDNDRAPKQEEVCSCTLEEIRYKNKNKHATVKVTNESNQGTVYFIINNKNFTTSSDGRDIPLPDTNKIYYSSSDKYNGEHVKLEIKCKLFQ